MVMLQSPNKTTDNNSPSLNGSQMSPNSNPDSPKSNTSPDVNKSNANENNNSGSTDIHSPTAKIPKFIITPQNNQNLANNNINSNNNNVAIKANDEGLRYSMERLKQLTEQHQQRLSPNAEEMDNDSQKNSNRRSQTPPQLQQRKIMELPPVRHLARPEPLQHPHAALLQQHPHLLQNPQFLAAAAQAQHQHHQQQQQQQNLHHHHHQHPAFHQHLPTAAAAAAAFHLRGPLSTAATTTLTLPSPANSPLSPPTSPNHNMPQQHQQTTHSELQQPHLLTPAPTTNPSIQLSTNSLQPSSSSTSTLLPNTHPTHLVNGQISIPPPLTATHLTLSPSSSSTTISSTSSLTQHDMDLEKLKLVAQAQAVVARSSAAAVAGVTLNGQAPPRPDLSDYGFRIQLGGLAAAAAAAAATSRQIAAANYARSDTSEELNVDGNDEESNDGSHGTPSVCPVDLTRSVPNSNLTSTTTSPTSTTSSTTTTSDKETTKRLAFSVENILDPNKFTGKNLQQHYNNQRWSCSGSSNYDRDEEMHDDEHSEDMSEDMFLILIILI
ncbi:Homeobox protein slou [Lucilia cuprina]|uniref:Homeobox protein slou n=1 Tax=Lucilia cuprina TaxID=7375 RepID=A0A0L0C7T2_LUCCU|nr:Homeobox protein slou [Lucilia cuprina]